MTDTTQQEVKDLDFLRRTREYREWYRNWKAKLASYENISSEYMRRGGYA